MLKENTKSLHRFDTILVKLAVRLEEIIISRDISVNMLAKQIGVYPGVIKSILNCDCNLRLKTIAILETALDEYLIDISYNNPR